MGQKPKASMEIIDARNQKPQSLFNVLVCYSLYDQDFWTRGFLTDNKWTVMLWNQKLVVPFEAINYWTNLPSIGD